MFRAERGRIYLYAKWGAFPLTTYILTLYKRSEREINKSTKCMLSLVRKRFNEDNKQKKKTPKVLRHSPTTYKATTLSRFCAARPPCNRIHVTHTHRMQRLRAHTHTRSINIYHATAMIMLLVWHIIWQRDAQRIPAIEPELQNLIMCVRHCRTLSSTESCMAIINNWLVSSHSRNWHVACICKQSIVCGIIIIIILAVG